MEMQRSQKTPLPPDDAHTIYVINMNMPPRAAGSPRRIAAAVQSIPGYGAVIEHYSKVSPRRIAALDPCAVILSGQGDPWDAYPEDTLAGVRAFVLAPDRPLLGICGGHQFIALAHGARIGRIKRLRPGPGYKGCFKHKGFVSVTPVKSDPVFGGKLEPLMLYQSHYDEVKNEPDNFDLIATSDKSPVQAIRHKTLPLYGFQFHPEINDAEHADGRAVLKRFLALCKKKSPRGDQIISTDDVFKR
jgi:GMP synthase (glutamine-hydrolysing)